MVKFLDNHFHITSHNSTVKTEILAGITNYFTVIYLIILVPEIIMESFPEAFYNGEFLGSTILENGLTANEMFIGLTAAAFIAAGIGTLFIGIFINVPFVQGPSLSVGTFITYTICRNFGYTFQQALAIVFIAAVCFFVISVLGVEKKLHRAIPNNIKFAVSAGIGMFIAYTGLEKAHIISFGNDGVKLFSFFGEYSHYAVDAILTLAVVVLIAVLLKKHIHGAIFIGKIVCIVLAVPLGLIKAVDIEKFSYGIPFSEMMFQLDFSGLVDLKNPYRAMFSILTIAILVFSICIMNVFETMGTLIATKSFIKISQDGRVKRRIPQMLEIDAASSAVGAIVGSPTVSTYVESTTGVIEGGRTGFTSVVTGVLFLITVFFTPAVSVIPSAATATTLITAGILMMNVIKYIDFENISEAVPAFFTMFMIPITKSLITGIALGIIMYVLINVFLKKPGRIKPILYILAIIFVITLIFLPR